jgi:hypothetical protein
MHWYGSPVFIVAWLLLRVTPVTPGVPLSVMGALVRIETSVFPFVGQGLQLRLVFPRLLLGSLMLRPAGSLSSLTEPLSENLVLRLPFTPPSSYVGELPNSHGRTLTNQSYVLHGMPYKQSAKRMLNILWLSGVMWSNVLHNRQ